MIFISLSLIILGVLSTEHRSSPWVRVLLMLYVFIVFTGSTQVSDYDGYEEMYHDVKYSSDYEPLFVLLMKFGFNLGLDFFHFRFITAGVSIITLNYAIGRLTKSPNIIWFLYLLGFSFMDTTPIRSTLAMPFCLIFLKELITAKNLKDYLKASVFVIIAALFHSSFWFFISFFPLWFLAKRKKGILWVLISLAVAIVVFVGTKDYLFDFYSLLMIRDYTIEKYQNDIQLNNNGVIALILEHIVCALPVMYVYYLRNKKRFFSSLDISGRSGYIHLLKAEKEGGGRVLLNIVNLDIVIFYLNLIFFALIPVEAITPTAVRLYRTMFVINVIYIVNQIRIRKVTSSIYFWIATFYAMFIMLKYFFYDAPIAFDTVFKEQLNSNYLFRMLP